jgi:hypothetical protein
MTEIADKGSYVNDIHDDKSYHDSDDDSYQSFYNDKQIAELEIGEHNYLLDGHEGGLGKSNWQDHAYERNHIICGFDEKNHKEALTEIHSWFCFKLSIQKLTFAGLDQLGSQEQGWLLSVCLGPPVRGAIELLGQSFQ